MENPLRQRALLIRPVLRRLRSEGRLLLRGPIRLLIRRSIGGLALLRLLRTAIGRLLILLVGHGRRCPPGPSFSVSPIGEIGQNRNIGFLFPHDTKDPQNAEYYCRKVNQTFYKSKSHVEEASYERKLRHHVGDLAKNTG